MQCQNCQVSTKNPKFCSRSCSVSFSNERRSLKSRIDRVKTLKETLRLKAQSKLPGPHTKVYLCKCKITGKEWWSKIHQLRIHPSVINTIKQYSYQCRFRFGISSYPNWFQEFSSLIDEFGWYSPTNKLNNLKGCSRDHLLSISDGFRLSIDPKLISHPANCRIIPHRLNQSKGKNSSITIEELYSRIERFESIYGNYDINLASRKGLEPF